MTSLTNTACDRRFFREILASVNFEDRQTLQQEDDAYNRKAIGSSHPKHHHQHHNTTHNNNNGSVAGTSNGRHAEDDMTFATEEEIARRQQQQQREREEAETAEKKKAAASGPNAATQMVIRCMKLALNTALEAIGDRQRERRLVADRDFDAKSRILFKYEADSSLPPTVSAASASAVRKSQNYYRPTRQRRGGLMGCCGGSAVKKTVMDSDSGSSSYDSDDSSEEMSPQQLPGVGASRRRAGGNGGSSDSDADTAPVHRRGAASSSRFDTASSKEKGRDKDKDGKGGGGDNDSDDGVQNVSSFAFTSYSPMCYRHIREFFGVSSDDFKNVLCNSGWHSIPTPGKSAAQLFFCGQNWVIKTTNDEESRFLRSILHRYYDHVRDNRFTLLPRFMGHYRLQVPGQNTITFVIMQNVFATPNKINEKFDLKGSTIGRFSSREEKMQATRTKKDLDINRPINLGAARRALLIDQIKADCNFLRLSDIMDYSLLVGIHHIPEGQAIDESSLGYPSLGALQNPSGSGNGNGNTSNAASGGNPPQMSFFTFNGAGDSIAASQPLSGGSFTPHRVGPAAAAGGGMLSSSAAPINWQSQPPSPYAAGSSFAQVQQQQQYLQQLAASQTNRGAAGAGGAPSAPFHANQANSNYNSNALISTATSTPRNSYQYDPADGLQQQYSPPENDKVGGGGHIGDDQNSNNSGNETPQLRVTAPPAAATLSATKRGGRLMSPQPIESLLGPPSAAIRSGGGAQNAAAPSTPPAEVSPLLSSEGNLSGNTTNAYYYREGSGSAGVWGSSGGFANNKNNGITSQSQQNNISGSSAINRNSRQFRADSSRLDSEASDSDSGAGSVFVRAKGIGGVAMPSQHQQQQRRGGAPPPTSLQIHFDPNQQQTAANAAGYNYTYIPPTATAATLSAPQHQRQSSGVPPPLPQHARVLSGTLLSSAGAGRSGSPPPESLRQQQQQQHQYLYVPKQQQQQQLVAYNQQLQRLHYGSGGPKGGGGVGFGAAPNGQRNVTFAPAGAATDNGGNSANGFNGFELPDTIVGGDVFGNVGGFDKSCFVAYQGGMLSDRVKPSLYGGGGGGPSASSNAAAAASSSAAAAATNTAWPSLASPNTPPPTNALTAAGGGGGAASVVNRSKKNSLGGDAPDSFRGGEGSAGDLSFCGDEEPSLQNFLHQRPPNAAAAAATAATAAVAVAAPQPLLHGAGIENILGANSSAFSLHSDTEGHAREVYYIGIIDILQEYNARKMAETFFKSIVDDRAKVSSLPAKEYAARFVSFMSSVVV